MNEFKLKHVKTGRVFYINKAVATIGRDKACDVVLALGYPSRNHAKISVINGQLTLEDLNSTNGTFVNDCKLDGPTIIKAGDIIKFSTEAYSLLKVAQDDKHIISGKLTSKSLGNKSNKVRPDINDTIIRPISSN